MSNNNGEILLRVENLCRYFKMQGKELKAVDDVSFDIKRGEVFGLVGESGCGKTTTGRTVIKLYDATSGSVYFKGHRIVAGDRSYKDAIATARADAARRIKALRADSRANPERASENSAKIAEVIAERDAVVSENRELMKRANYDEKNADREYIKARVEAINGEYLPRLAALKGGTAEHSALKREYNERLREAKRTRLVTGIQMIFQDPVASLDPRMTVREIISEGLVVSGVKDKKYIDEKVYEILELVGLVREHAGRYPHEFSGGQRQRIGVARAVIMRPDMIIADEPVSALDVSVQAQVINLLGGLKEQLGLTILFIAHDLSVVKYFSDRIGVMYLGRIVELADAEELFRHPLHPYTRSLLSAIPLPDPRSEKKRKRIAYNALAEHDYSVDPPSMREISEGHFVYCNDAEEKKYKERLNGEK